MITNISTAEHYRWGDVCDGWRLLSRPDLSVIQERIPPGAGEVRHFHSRARSTIQNFTGRLSGGAARRRTSGSKRRRCRRVLHRGFGSDYTG
jgi:hypothetical protein